jgi:hypothetical protein
VPKAKFEMKINAGITVEEFLNVLSKRLGDNFRLAIFDHNGKLNADIAIVRENRFIPPQHIAEHIIRESSSLSIIPIAGGG